MKRGLKETIMGLGVLGTGIVEFVEACDEGKHPILAMRDAYESTKARVEIAKETEAKMKKRAKRKPA